MCTPIALAALFLTSTPVYANELLALEAKSIALGDFCGIVYYTREDDGYRVVTTIAAGEDLPVRFVATLAENQELTISVPGKVGEPGQAIEILRASGTLIVNDHPAADALVCMPAALSE